MSQDVRRGLNTIRRICSEYRINGVFGPLVELVDCDEKFFTAVEVTAGNRYAGNLLIFTSHLQLSYCPLWLYSFPYNLLLSSLCYTTSLFHVVVENDEISTKIIRHLNSLKGGRVTFIPLNRVKAPHVNFPQDSGAIPLLRKLKYDSKFAPALGQVFLLFSVHFYAQQFLVTFEAFFVPFCFRLAHLFRYICTFDGNILLLCLC